MLGYLIKNKNDFPVATLNLVFYPHGDLEKIKEGTFKIVLTNSKNEEKVLKELDSFPGSEPAVYMLAHLIGDVLSVTN
jgi:hypothetical protein